MCTSGVLLQLCGPPPSELACLSGLYVCPICMGWGGGVSGGGWGWEGVGGGEMIDGVREGGMMEDDRED